MKEKELKSAGQLTISTVENVVKDETNQFGNKIKADDYILFICNRSNWIVTAITNRQGVVTPINPAIGRTCYLSVDECVNQKKYVPLLVTQCTEPSFGITIHIIHPKGVKADTPLVNVSPDCNYAGQLVTLSMVDPV